MNQMMKILKDVTPLNRVFCSSDYDRTVDYLCTFLPFNVHTYPAGNAWNGWVIPPKWDLIDAKIIKDGTVLYDGMQHALAVIALSKPFRGTIDLQELKKHLHYDTRYDDALPYHFRQMYRSWERTWGFCVPKKFYDSLEDGTYDVIIETEESEGVLKILEYTKKGKLDDTIIIAAHLDHPGMANDNLAGCAVGVALFKKLQHMDTKFSYQLLLHQEVMGPEYYLAHLSKKEREKLYEGIFIEMPGSRTKLGLQSAPQGMTNIEYFIKEELNETGIPFRHEPYGGVVVNGEYIFAGYGIPLSSISRYPYPEYHSDKDNISIIFEEELEESLGILVNAIIRMEQDVIVRKQYTGNICVSNSEFNLYVEPDRSSIEGFVPDEATKNIRKFMELFSMYNKPMPVRRLAEIFKIDYIHLYDYIKKWEEKGLVALV